MLILAIRTDNPKAEIRLIRGDRELACQTWMAHRQLAETIHDKIRLILTDQGFDLSDIQGIIVFQGPGSFTGLRIGLSVANALAYSLSVPIIGQSGNNWLTKGSAALRQGANEHLIIPEYGAAPHTTQPKK